MTHLLCHVKAVVHCDIMAEGGTDDPGGGGLNAPLLNMAIRSDLQS